jgi:hypothetical protein
MTNNYSFSTPPPGWIEDDAGNWVQDSQPRASANAYNHTFSTPPPSDPAQPTNPYTFRRPASTHYTYPGRERWTRPQGQPVIVEPPLQPEYSSYPSFGSGMGNLAGTNASYRNPYSDVVIGAVIGVILWAIIVVIIRGVILAIHGAGSLGRKVGQVRASHRTPAPVAHGYVISHSAGNGQVHAGSPIACRKCWG